MDVSCPKCQTVYEFDERQLRSGAVTLKCSQCQYLFRLENPASASGENQRRWMVRTIPGDILYFATFAVLHRWMMEGRVGPEDSISRTGKKWTPLGEIGEFMPIFQVVQSIANISGQSSAASESAAPSSATEEGSGSKERPQTPLSAPSIPSGPALARGRVSTEQGVGVASTRPPRRAHPMDTPATRTRAETPGPQSRKGGSGPRALPPAPIAREKSKPRVNIEDPRLRPQAPSGTFEGVLDADPEENWTLGELGLPEHPSQSGSSPTVHLPSKKSSKKGIWIALFVLAIIGGGGVWVWSDAERLSTLVGSGPETGVVTLGEARSSAAPVEMIPGKAEAGDVLSRAQLVALEIRSQQTSQRIDAASGALMAALEPATTASNRAHRPDFATLMSRGQSALQSGDGERARRLFHQAIEMNRNSPEAITGLGWALLSLGNTDAAAAQFQRALHRDGTYGDAYIGLGRAERSRGNTSEALRAYETYLQRHPNGSQASIARFQSAQLRESLGH